jgi:hypothetical protein
MQELKETVKDNLNEAQDFKKKWKKTGKVTQEVMEVPTVYGDVKKKYINVTKYPDGTTERKIVGLSKNGKVLWDKGIEKKHRDKLKK